MKKKLPLKAHPIQLVELYPNKLMIEAIEMPSRDVGVKVEDISIKVGVSDLEEDEDNKASIMVSVVVETKDDANKKLPFKMETELTGLFAIDIKEFKKEHIEDWAERASFYVLLPYVREYVYWLTYRCNFKPLILPLTEVPTIRYSDVVSENDRKASALENETSG